MRSLVFLCFCRIAAANAEVGSFDGESAKFLASLSRHDVAPSSGDVVGADYARETQAPMVWLNLHKSNLNAALSSPNVAYEDYASQRLVERHSE